MIYLDSSVALAYLLAEDRRPPELLWDEILSSSRLLEYELWTPIHARGLAANVIRRSSSPPAQAGGESLPRRRRRRRYSPSASTSTRLAAIRARMSSGMGAETRFAGSKNTSTESWVAHSTPVSRL